VYRSLVDEKQARRRALRHLARRLFNGSSSLLVLNVLDDEELDPLELQRLKKFIEDA
jgi:predicted transcriptional regulator